MPPPEVGCQVLEAQLERGLGQPLSTQGRCERERKGKRWRESLARTLHFAIDCGPTGEGSGSTPLYSRAVWARKTLCSDDTATPIAANSAANETHPMPTSHLHGPPKTEQTGVCQHAGTTSASLFSTQARLLQGAANVITPLQRARAATHSCAVATPQQQGQIAMELPGDVSQAKCHVGGSICFWWLRSARPHMCPAGRPTPPPRRQMGCRTVEFRSFSIIWVRAACRLCV